MNNQYEWNWYFAWGSPKGYVWYKWVFDWGFYGFTYYIRILGFLIQLYSLKKED